LSWHRAFECCSVCGTTEKPHQSCGMCKNCYDKARRAGLPAKAWSCHGHSCLKCGQTEEPHFGKGYCEPCYRAKYARQGRVCKVCKARRPYTNKGRCPACAKWFNRHGMERPIKGQQVELTLAPNVLKVGAKVRVPKWQLHGTIACESYVFLGERCIDLWNQYGERILRLPLRYVKPEEA